MKRLIVLLLVLALSLVSVGLVAGQESARLHALVVSPTTLLSEPNADAEPALDEEGAAIELAANTMVTVLGTDPTQGWIEVDAGTGTGFVPAENVVVLALAPLAQKALAVSNQDNAAALFAEPDLASEFIGYVGVNEIVTILGTLDQFAYVMTADGTTGWAVASPFEPLPEGAYPALVSLSSNPQLGIFTEPNITSEIVTTAENGALVWVLGPEGQYSQVLAPDGQQGYAVSSDLSPLPSAYVETEVSNAQAGLYAEPSQTAEILATLDSGELLYFVEAVDDYWAHVYHPEFGDAYVLRNNLSPVFTLGMVQTNNANVRACPNSETCAVISQVDAGTPVIIKGTNEAGDWYNVALPFSSILYPYRGVDGWMAAFLFQDAEGGTDFDPSVLSVTQ